MYVVSVVIISQKIKEKFFHYSMLLTSSARESLISWTNIPKSVFGCVSFILLGNIQESINQPILDSCQNYTCWSAATIGWLRTQINKSIRWQSISYVGFTMRSTVELIICKSCAVHPLNLSY